MIQRKNSQNQTTLFSSQFTFWVLATIFVAAQFYKFLFLAPQPEFGGDAAQKWHLARDFAHGSLEMFRMQESFNHHFVRWGTLVMPTTLIWAYGDELPMYYLSTAIPATIAALIFLGIFYRHFGFLVAVVVALIWFLDDSLNRAFFQLLPSGASLLPLALIVLVFQKFIDGKLSDAQLTGLLGFLLFWLYGAKETNIFFAPGLFFAVWSLSGRRYAIGLAATFVALYVFEAVLLSLLLGEVIQGGRLLALLSSDAQHLKGMFTNNGLVEQQERLWDAGIISRWYTVPMRHVPIYLPAIIVSFVVVATSGFSDKDVPRSKIATCIGMLLISFAILTSFFIVSLNPLRLGQPIEPRYLTIVLPFAVFILIFTLHQFVTRSHHGRFLIVVGIALILIGVAILQFGSNRVTREQYLNKAIRIILVQGTPRQTLIGWMDYYNDFGQELSSDVCELEGQTTKQLYYGLMYVPESAGGQVRRQTFGPCLKNKLFDGIDTSEHRKTAPIAAFSFMPWSAK